MTILLAQAVSSAFLIDPVKPVLLLVPALVGAALTSRLTKDIRFCGLPSEKWHATMIGGTLLGLALGLLVPIFWIGWPLQIAATAAPFLLYWPKRNNAVPEKLRFVIGGEKVKAFFKSRRKTQAFAGSKLSFKDSAKKERAVPGKNDPGLAVHQATEKLLVPAIERGASRMDMVVKPDGVAAVITVDGVRSKIEAPTTEVAMQVIDNLKDLCGLDLKERRRRQNGSCWVNTTDATQTMSLMVAGSSSAQQVRVDFDLNKRMGKPVQDLGLLPAQMKLVESIVSNDEPGGVVLVAAAAGQGLTTTSLAMLARHDAFTAAVKALEKNSMHRLEGVDHQLWNPSGGVEFHTQLQSIVRRGPDVVFVDDVTDPGTGKVIASPTSSDTRFYVALPVDGVGPAITEWFRAVGDVKMAAAPLRAVVAVRMIRKLCIACRVPFQPSPEQAKRLAIPAGKAVELFRAGGKVQIKSKVEDCPLCKGTGFSGQIGVFEVVILDAEAREHLAKGDLKSAYNASRLKFKAPGMQEAALMRVREGVTSLEEVVRVFTPPAAKPAAAGAKPTAKPATPPAAGGTPPKPKA
jgi:type II secretory ATPase GspE/PulE/Tfp pilus assembly ATPase PilB-like protein